VVKYYNKDTQKILTSYNFRFVKPHTEKITNTEINDQITYRNDRGLDKDMRSNMHSPEIPLEKPVEPKKHPETDEINIDWKRTRGVKIGLQTPGQPVLR